MVNLFLIKGEELLQSGLAIPAISVGPNAGGSTIIINGGMTMMFPNVYIFCVSQNDVNNSLNEYDSQYAISNPHLFAIELVRLLTNQLKISDFEENDFLHSEIAQMRINCYHRPVQYLEKPIACTMDNRMDVLKILNDVIGSYFLKSAEKSDDQEYRFVLIPMIGQRILSVKNEAKILNISPFDGIIHPFPN